MSNSKTVLKPKDVHYLTYEPRSFKVPIPEQAVPFARSQETDVEKPFLISDLVAEKTKLSDLERKNYQARVQGEVLSRLKEVEERGYTEAYNLGLKEGREKGFSDMTGEIKTHVDQLKALIEEVLSQKKNLAVSNEKHLVETIFHVAKAIALDEIKANPENILAIATKALEHAESEEEIVMKINPSDKTFLESVTKTAGNPFEKMTRLKFEGTDAVSPGGVIVETNYGMVDATIETRVRKVFEALMSKTPSSKGEKSD